jgi:hypothetical protein
MGRNTARPALALVVAELADGIAGAGVRPAVAGEARRDVAGISLLDAGQRDVGEQGGEDVALRGAGLGAREHTVGQDARLQECPDQSCHPQVGDAPAQARHDVMVVDMVEAALDVPFDDPLIGRTRPISVRLRAGGADRVPDVLQSVATRPARAEAIRDGQELRLQDRLEQLQERGLHDAIPHGRHTERPELARLAALRNHHPPHRGRPIAARAQHRPHLGEEGLDADARLDATHRHPVHPDERAPRLLATRLHARRRFCGWVTQFQMSRHASSGLVRLHV